MFTLKTVNAKTVAVFLWLMMEATGFSLAGSHPTQEAVIFMVTVLSTSCSCLRPASFRKSLICGYSRKGDSSLCIAVVCNEGDHITRGQVWRTARMGETEKNLQSVAGRPREKRSLADQMG
jgi:hypothetical protein